MSQSILPGQQQSQFNAPAKWEQNLLTHSVGTVKVNDETVEFSPHKISVLGKNLSIPISQIQEAQKRDNFLWRGAVKLTLSKPYEGREVYVFFLGSRYRELLEFVHHRLKEIGRE